MYNSFHVDYLSKTTTAALGTTSDTNEASSTTSGTSTTKPGTLSTPRTNTPATKLTTKALSTKPGAGNSSAAAVVILKGKHGSMVAKGTIFHKDRTTIHGRPCQKDCQVVTIEEVMQVNAKP